ncbi:iron complex transport system permease protein [Sinosporangium album]|uniref:Iron complex transport system permease protein n=1 Tax=Sinosporangium album TaxID=504805 RepID=A0A1G7T0Q8_9ACTN|nr:iron chelate uptake ABC transporter family permease subunit [Sinosporangium album]SDG28801.1 iron complex transport system permease protein [Sinosporangium album]
MTPPQAADARPGPTTTTKRPGPAGGMRRVLLWLVLSVAVLAVASALSLAVGANALPLSTVWEALTNYNADNPDHLVIVEKRLPRTLVGLAAGAAFAVAGAVMQGLTRNPIAEPGLLGVNSGASLAVVIGITVFNVTDAGGYVWFAFAGAAAASVLVYAIGSRGREGSTPVKLALAGAAVTAVLTSLVSAVLLTNRTALDSMRFWQVGSLAARDLDILWRTLPSIAAGLLLALAISRALNGLALGEDVARGLGQRVGLTRALAAVCIVLLCGGATAAVGPIGFIGLIVPHAVRHYVGPDHRALLPLCAVTAPSLLLVCDVIGRVVSRPGELQVGVIAALVGAPLFIALIRPRKAVSL